MSLRDYQVECLNRCLGSEGGLCVLPTGSGKSHIIAALTKTLNKPNDTLVLTPRAELVRQNANKIDNGTYVCTINLAHARDMSYKILIIDEAHLVRLNDGMYQNMIKKADLVFGFTATPYRLDIGHLSPNIFKRILFEVKREKLEGRYLTPRRKFKIPDKLLINVKNDNFNSRAKLSTDVCPQTEGCLNHFMQNHEGKSLIFGCDIKHCKEIKKIIPSSEIVHSKMGKIERGKIINKFLLSDYGYLVNCEILTTGFDDPSIKNIVILRPTDSYTLHEQMLGRGDRLYPLKDWNNIYDYTLNSYNFEGISKKINNINYCIFCFKLTDYRLKQCSHCNKTLIKGESPSKKCSNCKYKNFNIAVYCKNCGEFIKKNVNKIESDKILIKPHFNNRIMMMVEGIYFEISKTNVRSFIKTTHSEAVSVERTSKGYIYSNLKPFILYWKMDYMTSKPKIIKISLG